MNFRDVSAKTENSLIRHFDDVVVHDGAGFAPARSRAPFNDDFLVRDKLFERLPIPGTIGGRAVAGGRIEFSEANVFALMDQTCQLLSEQRDARLIGRSVKAKGTLSSEVSIPIGVVSEHPEHVEPGAAIVNEVIVLGPVHLGHHVAGSGMLRQVHQPVVAVPRCLDEKESVVTGATSLHQPAIETTLDEGCISSGRG